MLNLMNVLVHGKYDRQPAGQQNEDTEKDQSVDGNDIVVQEG